MANALNWFEIPATDFDRAKNFYETILDITMEIMPHPTFKYGIFPATIENGNVGGGLVEGEGFVPSTTGAIIYLNAQPDLSVALGKVEAAEGKIVLPKTSIGGNGFMAHIIDTEGNKVALHSMG